MKVLFKVYLQKRRVEVWLDPAVVELLALRFRGCVDAHTCHFVIQRWLGVSARQHFGQAIVEDEQVKQWVGWMVRAMLV